MQFVQVARSLTEVPVLKVPNCFYLKEDLNILVSAFGHSKTIVPAYEGIELPVIGLGVFDVNKVIVSSPKSMSRQRIIGAM